MTHSEAKVDEFAGQESRVGQRSRDLEAVRLEENLRRGNHVPLRDPVVASVLDHLIARDQREDRHGETRPSKEFDRSLADARPV